MENKTNYYHLVTTKQQKLEKDIEALNQRLEEILDFKRRGISWKKECKALQVQLRNRNEELLELHRKINKTVDADQEDDLELEKVEKAIENNEEKMQKVNEELEENLDELEIDEEKHAPKSEAKQPHRKNYIYECPECSAQFNILVDGCCPNCDAELEDNEE